jgi:hypothetical protein
VLTSGTMPDGRLYYTMEYVPGSDLEQVWRELRVRYEISVAMSCLRVIRSGYGR